MHTVLCSYQPTFPMSLIRLSVLGGLLLLFACERSSPCETDALLQGEALRFYDLTPAQIDSFQVLQPQGPFVLQDAEVFQTWAQAHAPDLMEAIDFAQEAVLPAGTRAETANGAIDCIACSLIRVSFRSRQQTVVVKEEFVPNGCDRVSYRSPRGLLVIRRPPFVVEGMSMSASQSGR